MASFKRFEEINGWQKARELTSLVYSITREGDFARDFGLKDQMRRASVSIMNNIAEGFGRHSDAEFARFLEIAKASAYEVQSCSYVALDAGYIDERRRTEVHTLADTAAALISGLTKFLRG
jgi:four helix bundle protein